ncbi:nucleopolyhedrovirus P10 family protein [Streptomyces yokosukanensis]|uniref:Nucleopolyhedrovirus P10 family protein n=1 Tax=Streptomyces yokosukanensis TaxID=67386 RepID=A0A101P390_9ACTN|nr:nucleopolyhedrovirus P10 family protein [Streptomyces yokosukanensis]KUN04097.1 nucleopolyhedrovirus P10 family protein [Streptomyces yokosukanensis]
MTADRWTESVRRQVALGRLLPLGGPRDGAWIAEGAAAAVLRRAAGDEVPEIRLGTLRLALAAPEEADEPVVPAPPSALPPGGLRLTADFAATAAEPLPAVASRLRLTLATAATRLLGLMVSEVDLRVTDLLEAAEPPLRVRVPQPAAAREPTDLDEARVAAAALAVPGVRALTACLGGLGRAVLLQERATESALAHRHARVELATTADRRTLDVARQVRTAVRDTLEDRPTVAVLVTAVG